VTTTPSTEAAPQPDGGHGPPLPRRTRVLVVGAGFAGVAAAVELERSGERDVVVVEQADEVGGTWRDNSYPGCACDVPSHLYSLSWAPNPGWTRSFAPREEIQRYLVDVATRTGVRARTRFGTRLEAADWDDDAQVWRVRTSRGDLDAEVLVLGTGALSAPAVPALPGLGSFAGEVFHSARWDPSFDPAGRRVAVVGTGASAVQLVPHLQREALAVTVVQRTPSWVLPRGDRPIGPLRRALYRRVPATQRLARTLTAAWRETWAVGFVALPAMMRPMERASLRHLARQVPDADLRARLTPSFRLGCKRVLLSDDWYPALAAPNVDLVDDPVVEVVPEGLVSRAPDGTRTTHAADALVLATGFRATDPPFAHVVSAGGRTLAEHWSGTGMQAHLGLAVAGFPNLFLLMGPNTGQGHTSVLLFVEAQARYVAGLLRRTRGAGAVQPRARAQERSVTAVHRRLRRTVWSTGGCRSWYLDDQGRNPTLWPGFAQEYRYRLRRVDLDDWDVAPRRAAAAAPGRTTTQGTEEVVA
jgi:cation diffusion facilitator CzcD-associated flavoprotein CzcO